MPVKFLKRVNANEQEVQGGQKIPRLQGAANIPVESDTCHGYSSNWRKKSKIDFVQKCGDGVYASYRGELGYYGLRTEARQH
jgi:hypothetical protein